MRVGFFLCGSKWKWWDFLGKLMSGLGLWGLMNVQQILRGLPECGCGLGSMIEKMIGRRFLGIII